jgi:hypothetical protein
MRAGRGNGLVGGVIAQTLTWLNGEIITPDLTYNQSAALAAVTEIAGEVNQAGASGGLVIDGLNVSATNAESARTLDIAATMALLDAELTALDGGAEIPLVIREAPASIAELDASADLARAALSGPITLIADDGMGNTLGPWTIQPEQIAVLLDVQLVEQADSTYRNEVALDIEPYRA